MERGNFKQLVLETKRLWLKEINPDIYYNLFSFYNDHEISQFLGLESENELELERRKFEGGLFTYNITFKKFLLVDKSTNRIIGSTGFHNWFIYHYRAEIGYKITDDRYLQQGYITEANRMVLEYGFKKMELNRVEANIGPNNIASLKTIRKLGFKEEGLLREHYFVDNKIEDSLIFSLLKREYMNMTQKL